MKAIKKIRCLKLALLSEKEINKNHLVKRKLKQNKIKNTVPYSNLMIGLSVSALIANTLLYI
jgi:hypothetical protein